MHKETNIKRNTKKQQQGFHCSQNLTSFYENLNAGRRT